MAAASGTSTAPKPGSAARRARKQARSRWSGWNHGNFYNRALGPDRFGPLIFLRSKHAGNPCAAIGRRGSAGLKRAAGGLALVPQAGPRRRARWTAEHKRRTRTAVPAIRRSHRSLADFLLLGVPLPCAHATPSVSARRGEPRSRSDMVRSRKFHFTILRSLSRRWMKKRPAPTENCRATETYSSQCR